ncbi:death-associated inhibitor of apoptosis 1-like [Littorina saxatilis]|uniref:RING-type domain-containing protein n=1 Tax=Littorina saxatilis TaxID=31220 RepID=A0AAN9GH58_9CAEN
MEANKLYGGYPVGEHPKHLQDKMPDSGASDRSTEQLQCENREDDHDVHSQEKQTEEIATASHPAQNDKELPDRAVELHDPKPQRVISLEICSEKIDLPRQEASQHFVDENDLRLKCSQEETTEKKLSDPVEESDDDENVPLELRQYLKIPFRHRVFSQNAEVYMLAHPQLPTPVAEKRGTQEQSSPKDYHTEMSRLGTYSAYPADIPVFAIKLAHYGFIYRDDCKAVDCYFCQFRIPLSELNHLGADPAKMHREGSPTCPMLQGLNCTNVPFPKPEQFPQVAEASRKETTAVEVVDRGRESGAVQTVATKRSEPRAPTYQTDSVVVPSSPIMQQQSPQQSSYSHGATVADSVPLTQQPESPNAKAKKNRSRNGNESPSQNLPATTQSATASSTAESTRTRNSTASRPSTNSSVSAPKAAASNGNSSAAATQNGSNGKGNGATGNGGSKVEPPKEKKKLTYSDLGIFAEKPKRADMAVLQKRLSTFTGKWKSQYTQTPKMLADAGMYYAGYADCARCFFCGGGLKNWEAPDNPWIEHARWFPKCAYIRMCKGPKFVEIVQKKNKNKEDMTLQEVEVEAEADSPKVDNGIDNTKAPVSVSSSVGPDTRGMTATVGGADYTSVTGDLENLEAENEDLKTQMSCKICMDEDSSVVFLPCGHLVACTGCAIALKICPLCRTDIKGSVRAHMVN